MRWVGAGFALCVFSNVVGQCFGGRYAHAGADANAAVYAAAYGMCAARGIWHAMQADEAFINAVDLLLWAHACGQTHRYSNFLLSDV